ncbi:uncharacterized protein LOC108737474 [Agrilus planipennis]|uniref:Uncharacterized protein LOC108737474 n=1 Tax=Agrilus planipennis TaxID=224129 RepID=A0A1W4X0B4_AGRPL|nr:uncharacterized protein LOC108737474 [Agrilus planipennis]XP_018325834.1 uncharacterized protein LOC108737474 [Agrilus planipennis]
MPDLTSVRNLNLKVIFLVHVIFVSLACMGGWSTNAYLFYNSILIISLLWGIYHPESDEPIQLGIVMNAISIILDILLLCFSFPSNHWARESFSAAVAILHLLARPISIIFLGKIHQERSGTGIDLFGGRNRSYEDMDRSTPPTQPPATQGGYDFSTAQPI